MRERGLLKEEKRLHEREKKENRGSARVKILHGNDDCSGRSGPPLSHLGRFGGKGNDRGRGILSRFSWERNKVGIEKNKWVLGKEEDRRAQRIMVGKETLGD